MSGLLLFVAGLFIGANVGLIVAAVCLSNRLDAWRNQ